MGEPTMPLNPLQLEMLQLLNRELSPEDISAIKRLIVKYFSEKAIEAADKFWDENNLTEEHFLNLHERTPYPL